MKTNHVLKGIVLYKIIYWHYIKLLLSNPAAGENLPGPNAYESEKSDNPGSKRAPSFSMAKRLVASNGECCPFMVNLLHEWL